MRLSLFALPVLLMILVGGCRHAQVISVDVRATEKDVLVYSVELDRSLDPEGYLEWAQRDLIQRGSLANPFYSQPVYELLYSFHSGNTQLATVLYRRANEGVGHLEHCRTLVYPPQPGSGRP